MELRIKEIIKEKGTTIQSIADAIGVNRVTLSNSINGNPTLETLNKIADALGVSVTELFEQPKLNTAQFTCPHCGKSINIKVE